MSTITGEDILKALKNDPHFAKMNKKELDILIPFILKAPEIFSSELLSSKVDVRSFFDAKVVFISYCLNNNFAKKTAQVTASMIETAKAKFTSVTKKIDQYESLPIEEMAKMAKSSLKAIVKSYQLILDLLPRALPLLNDTKAKLFVGGGMTKQTAKRCVTEYLTIADLLLIEPGAIFIFNPMAPQE